MKFYKKEAPWGVSEIRALWRHQTMGTVHPYTCVTHSSDALIPTRDGWICSIDGCDYSQNWAHFGEPIFVG